MSISTLDAFDVLVLVPNQNYTKDDLKQAYFGVCRLIRKFGDFSFKVKNSEVVKVPECNLVTIGSA